MNRCILATSLWILPQLIFAHGAHGSDFIAGLTHPILGIDHFIVLLAIGIIGHSLMNEKPWLLSILFIIAMTIGGMKGIHEDPIANVELIIKGSIILTGVVLFFQLEFTLVGFALMAILLGYFHGHAHGTEMPSGSDPFKYVLGYVIGAILISLAGYGLSKLIHLTKHYQILGIAIVILGVLAFTVL